MHALSRPTRLHPTDFTAAAYIGGGAVDVLHRLLDPVEGDAAVARALHSADLLEQRIKAQSLPPVKEPAVTRERKAKYGDGNRASIYCIWTCVQAIVKDSGVFRALQ